MAFSLQTVRPYGPGLLFAAVVAMASLFVSQTYGGPTMLYALLLGVAFHVLSVEGPCAPGIAFTGKTVLRLGVALLGSQIMVSDFLSLGALPILLVISAIGVTLVIGTFIGKLLKLDLACSVLAAGAVAICGASAALAISSVLPKDDMREKNTLLIIVGVTGLSTLAMILYPSIVGLIGLSPVDGGIFLGVTIHDVAQVVGAGYMISPEAGETATMVKLLRVACLAPVVVCIGLMFRRTSRADTSSRPPLLPLFLVGFVVLVAINSTGMVPQGVTSFAGSFSRFCLIMAVAAIGAKISVKEMMALGPRPLAALSLQTFLLAGFALAVLLFAAP